MRHVCSYRPSVWNNLAPLVGFSLNFVSDDTGQIYRESASFINPLKPNDQYRGRTAQLTSKRCILYIYSTNIDTEYLNTVYTLRFSSSKCSLFHNSNVFGSCIIHILYMYSTNIDTEYFKHGVYTLGFFLFKMQFVS